MGRRSGWDVTQSCRCVLYDSSSARIGALGGLGEGHFFFEPHPFFFLPELFFAELFLVFLAAVILTPF